MSDVATCDRWFADLPDGWDAQPLRWIVASVQTGVWGEEPDGGPDDRDCVRVADFDRASLRSGPARTRRKVPPADFERCLLRRGDILLERSGGTDRSPVGFAVLKADDTPAVPSNFISLMRVASLHDPRYVLFALAAAYATGFTQRSVKRTTGIQNLDLRSYLSERLPVPPLDEQRAIADYLDRETARIDDLIAEQERLIELLRERRLAALRRATRAESVDAPAPQWPELRLSWLFSRTGSGTTPPDHYLAAPDEQGVLWVTTGELRENVVQDSKRRVRPEALSEISALRLHPAGSLVVAMYGATIGRLAFLGTAATVNQACCVLAGATPEVDTQFVALALTARREELVYRASGGGQPNINQDTLRGLRIPLPPLPEQQRILAELTRSLTKIDALIAKAQQFIELSKERRAALITAAVTGQTDVREMAA